MQVVDAIPRAGRFLLGSRVSICSDEAGTRILKFGTVKRIGNEGSSWRLQGTGEWYDAMTGRRIGFDDPHYARPYREGDDELLLAEQARVRKLNADRNARRIAETNLLQANSRVQGYMHVFEIAMKDIEDYQRRLSRARERFKEAEADLERARTEKAECRKALDEIVGSTSVLT